MNTATTHNHIATGQQVITTEARGLQILADSLTHTFNEAVELLARTTGHVVLTGVGKSGHIASKIAATMASTGTPAIFVHAGEASHGDLGMIGHKDTVIALSDSGESEEMRGIIDYCQELAVPLIAITRAPASTLGKAANITLIIPAADAACPLRLAPTTSTTMALALGDALAVAVLQKRGFTEDQFRKFHPGGKIGKNLLKVADLMVTGDSIPLCTTTTPMMDVILEMTAKRLGCAGIIDDEGRLTGIITDGDLRRHMGRDILALTANAIMTPAPKTIDASTYARAALERMNERQITTLFVVNTNRKPIGVIHIHDCIRAGLGD